MLVHITCTCVHTYVLISIRVGWGLSMCCWIDQSSGYSVKYFMRPAERCSGTEVSGTIEVHRCIRIGGCAEMSRKLQNVITVESHYSDIALIQRPL